MVSSLLVQRYHLGSIVKCRVANSITHYFNDLDGMWIDTTRAQFPRNRSVTKIEYNPNPSTYIFDDTMARVDLLERRVMEIIQ